MQIKSMQYECSVREKKFKTNLSTKKSVPFLQQKLIENKNDFNHSNLVTSPSLFPYLCGLNIHQFNILVHCIVPCLHSIPCSDCVGGTNYRKLDSTLIISYNNNVGLFSQQHYSVEIYQKPPSGSIMRKIPNIFVCPICSQCSLVENP